jgi:hypothetical protein
MPAFIDMLRTIAERHGLRFIDARQSFDFPSRELTKVDTIAVHSYGIGRKQAFDAIVSWYKQKGVAAHIYISTGPYSYLALAADLDKSAQHVAVHNPHCVGIEVNEARGNVISAEDNEVLRDVIKAINTSLERDLAVCTHRDLTGKDCPKGYILNNSLELTRI